MAIDDADGSEAGHFEGAVGSAGSDGEDSPVDSAGELTGQPATVGAYTWENFLEEHGHEDVAADLYDGLRPIPGSERWEEDAGPRKPTGDDWDRVDFDPGTYLAFHPDDLEPRIAVGGGNATALSEFFESFCDPETTPVVKDEYLWEHYKREYYYDENGDAPREDGEKVPFDPAEKLGFDPENVGGVINHLGKRADELDEVIEERTVDVNEELDEDVFFSTEFGTTTVVNRYDLEKAVPLVKKSHFREIERYWVNKPYAFVVIFHSTKENEKKYYLVEPYRNPIEDDLVEYMTGKLRTAIKYADGDIAVDGADNRRSVIEEQTHELLDRYDLYTRETGDNFANSLADSLGLDGEDDGMAGRLLRLLGWESPEVGISDLDGIAARPEPAVLEDDADTLNEYQVEKLLYFLVRDFIGYELIDGIKHDINVEDVSCDGYNSPVFVYHGDYEQIISNVYHGETELDDFVVKLAQRSGKGISKRRPQVDATLPDGSRAQLTLGREVSDHGTNYTIRQFKDVPFTPIDLINWHTFSLEEMGFLWLCIENNKSLIFAGGTASGKTTSLNAVSLFIPSNSKIVSIEDTREVELPQRNWIASVTRPSFSDDDKGDVDEFDLLEAALRQRPDYIVMGEIRGEEGRTLFQVMSTGHTTYTTFHADSVGEVLKRFTTAPINVSKTMFTALDLVSIQTSTRVRGNKVRRNKSLTEINHYDAENDEINVQDIYQWQAESDQYLQMGESNTLDEIMFDRGWSEETLNTEVFMREVVIAYLIKHGLNTYTQVAATIQAFINDQETILSLIANDELERSLEDLREMESVLIDVDPEKEEMVPRPDPTDRVLREAERILAQAEERLLAQYRGEEAGSVASALANIEEAPDVDASPGRTTTDRPESPALEADDERDSTPELDEGRDSTPELDTPHDPDESPSALDPAFDDGAAPAGASADTESFDDFDSDESFDDFPPEKSGLSSEKTPDDFGGDDPFDEIGGSEAFGEFGSSNAFDEFGDEDPFGGVDASGHGSATGFGDDVAYIGSDLPAVGPSDEEDEHEFDTWGDRDIDPSVDRTYSLDDDPTETFDETSTARRRRDGNEGHDEREGLSDDDWNFGVGDSESEEER